MKVSNNISAKLSPAEFAGCLVGLVDNPSHFISAGQRTTTSYTRHKEAPLSSKDEDNLDDLPIGYTGLSDVELEGILAGYGEYEDTQYYSKSGDGQGFVSFWEGKVSRDDDFLLDCYEDECIF